MALMVDGLASVGSTYWKVSATGTTSLVSSFRTVSSNFVDISKQEATVTNVGLVSAEFDPEWAAIFAMET
jgi:hypothetical protein